MLQVDHFSKAPNQLLNSGKAAPFHLFPRVLSWLA